mmetsp:Transcript_17072/g.40637  ORF Transcript_17072/g.40637 Transcript_17072/m.40637 type:complete len:326 (+) Transcript_17072:526-1503(+)
MGATATTPSRSRRMTCCAACPRVQWPSSRLPTEPTRRWLPTGRCCCCRCCSGTATATAPSSWRSTRPPSTPSSRSASPWCAPRPRPSTTRRVAAPTASDGSLAPSATTASPRRRPSSGCSAPTGTCASRTWTRRGSSRLTPSSTPCLRLTCWAAPTACTCPLTPTAACAPPTRSRRTAATSRDRAAPHGSTRASCSSVRRRAPSTWPPSGASGWTPSRVTRRSTTSSPSTSRWARCGTTDPWSSRAATASAPSTRSRPPPPTGGSSTPVTTHRRSPSCLPTSSARRTSTTSSRAPLPRTASSSTSPTSRVGPRTPRSTGGCGRRG